MEAEDTVMRWNWKPSKSTGLEEPSGHAQVNFTTDLHLAYHSNITKY